MAESYTFLNDIEKIQHYYKKGLEYAMTDENNNFKDVQIIIIK